MGELASAQMLDSLWTHRVDLDKLRRGLSLCSLITSPEKVGRRSGKRTAPATLTALESGTQRACITNVRWFLATVRQL